MRRSDHAARDPLCLFRIVTSRHERYDSYTLSPRCRRLSTSPCTMYLCLRTLLVCILMFTLHSRPFYLILILAKFSIEIKRLFKHYKRNSSQHYLPLNFENKMPVVSLLKSMRTLGQLFKILFKLYKVSGYGAPLGRVLRYYGVAICDGTPSKRHIFRFNS